MNGKKDTVELLREAAQLDRTGRILTVLAKTDDIGPIYERKNLVNTCIEYLRAKKSILLVGEHGVGKNAIVESIALRMIKAPLTNFPWQHIVETNTVKLQSGVHYMYNLENKIELFIKNCIDQKVIFFFDNLHLGIGVGASTADPMSDMINIIHGTLPAPSALCMIGAITPDGLKKLERVRPGFANSFIKIEIPPTSPDETNTILHGMKKEFESKHCKTIDDEVLVGIVKQYDRFCHWREFPGKSFEALSTLIAENWDKPRITIKEFQSHIKKMTGLPVFILDENVSKDISDVEKYFKKFIFGQDEAINEIAHTIVEFKSRLDHPVKPVGSFLFAGTSGVGKTELAKILAKYLFGSEDKLFVYPMSQYRGNHGCIKLLGSAGLYGREVLESGKLLNDVRTSPFSVILFDEIDQAGLEIFSALYQILDEGKFIEQTGRGTSFKSSIIIMSTNVGMDNLLTGKLKSVYRDVAGMRERMFDALENKFKAPFLNRLTKIVVFNTLGKDVIKEVAFKTIENLAEILPAFEERSLQFTVSDEILQRLVTEGFNEKYGARFMKSTVRDYCIKPISVYLSQNTKVKNKNLHLQLENGKVAVKLAKPGK